jgi:hypothetical protein
MNTPDRAPSSVRRTSTIDMSWPAGPRAELHLHGRGRDLLTGADPADTRVLATASVRAVVTNARQIQSIDSQPEHDWLRALVGAPAISGFRRRLAAQAPAGSADSLLYQLLDDTPGASIVSDFAQRQWSVYEQVNPDGSPAPALRVVGICAGFAPGSTALRADGSSTGAHRTTTVDTLPRRDDPLGWHDFPEPTVMAMRRARRVDVRVGATIEIDSMFQDSCTLSEGGRRAVHEYTLRATAEPASGRLVSLEATPGNLPYAECPFAAANIDRLVGTPLAELRAAVTAQLKGVAGCTHLNDALRALGAVPALLGALSPAS